MADPTREGWEKFKLTKLYKDWAVATPGNVLDAKKLDKKLAGLPSTKPSSGPAQAWFRMLDALTPIPPPPDPMSPVWKRDAVFSTALSSFADPARSIAIDLKWTNICPQLLHGSNVAHNAAELALIGPGLRAKGCALTGWGTFGQDTDPAEDARLAVALVKALKLDGWIANGELWAEGVNIWKSQVFIDAWFAAGGAGIPLSTSCLASDTASFARPYDFAAWLRVPGCAIMPQVYGNVNPGYTWQATLGMLKKANVPTERISMTFGTYIDSVEKLPIPYSDYVTWQGARGAYIGESMPPGGWVKMKRT